MLEPVQPAGNLLVPAEPETGFGLWLTAHLKRSTAGLLVKQSILAVSASIITELVNNSSALSLLLPVAVDVEGVRLLSALLVPSRFSLCALLLSGCAFCFCAILPFCVWRVGRPRRRNQGTYGLQPKISCSGQSMQLKGGWKDCQQHRTFAVIERCLTSSYAGDYVCHGADKNDRLRQNHTEQLAHLGMCCTGNGETSATNCGQCNKKSQDFSHCSGQSEPVRYRLKPA
ncbi:hypothetical protein V5799_007256 [Amblyomma americanum]|uniref:Uncharacterized protein n=1 Tax=Amblyomma americanum TaxID=6943 RepID=A0AAQ4DU22_AMBAM